MWLEVASGSDDAVPAQRENETGLTGTLMEIDEEWSPLTCSYPCLAYHARHSDQGLQALQINCHYRASECR